MNLVQISMEILDKVFFAQPNLSVIPFQNLAHFHTQLFHRRPIWFVSMRYLLTSIVISILHFTVRLPLILDRQRPNAPQQLLDILLFLDHLFVFGQFLPDSFVRVALQIHAHLVDIHAALQRKFGKIHASRSVFAVQLIVQCMVSIVECQIIYVVVNHLSFVLFLPRYGQIIYIAAKRAIRSVLLSQFVAQRFTALLAFDIFSFELVGTQINGFFAFVVFHFVVEIVVGVQLLNGFAILVESGNV
mmetsp:Transcript_8587/g.14121  ORF Transcript_8587/g.14121 Transcript_8587/m.14121 type:complete len:245 (+) Transcript_8587:395-1129(+)